MGRERIIASSDVVEVVRKRKVDGKKVKRNSNGRKKTNDIPDDAVAIELVEQKMEANMPDLPVEEKLELKLEPEQNINNKIIYTIEDGASYDENLFVELLNKESALIDDLNGLPKTSLEEKLSDERKEIIDNLEKTRKDLAVLKEKIGTEFLMELEQKNARRKRISDAKTNSVSLVKNREEKVRSEDQQADLKKDDAVNINKKSIKSNDYSAWFAGRLKMQGEVELGMLKLKNEEEKAVKKDSASAIAPKVEIAPIVADPDRKDLPEDGGKYDSWYKDREMARQKLLAEKEAEKNKKIENERKKIAKIYHEGIKQDNNLQLNSNPLNSNNMGDGKHGGENGEYLPKTADTYETDDNKIIVPDEKEQELLKGDQEAPAADPNDYSDLVQATLKRREEKGVKDEKEIEENIGKLKERQRIDKGRQGIEDLRKTIRDREKVLPFIKEIKGDYLEDSVKEIKEGALKDMPEIAEIVEDARKPDQEPLEKNEDQVKNPDIVTIEAQKKEIADLKEIVKIEQLETDEARKEAEKFKAGINKINIELDKQIEQLKNPTIKETILKYWKNPKVKGAIIVGLIGTGVGAYAYGAGAVGVPVYMALKGALATQGIDIFIPAAVGHGFSTWGTAMAGSAAGGGLMGHVFEKLGLLKGEKNDKEKSREGLSKLKNLTNELQLSSSTTENNPEAGNSSSVEQKPNKKPFWKRIIERGKKENSEDKEPQGSEVLSGNNIKNWLDKDGNIDTGAVVKLAEEDNPEFINELKTDRELLNKTIEAFKAKKSFITLFSKEKRDINAVYKGLIRFRKDIEKQIIEPTKTGEPEQEKLTPELALEVEKFKVLHDAYKAAKDESEIDGKAIAEFFNDLSNNFDEDSVKLVFTKIKEKYPIDDINEMIAAANKSKAVQGENEETAEEEPKEELKPRLREIKVGNVYKCVNPFLGFKTGDIIEVKRWGYPEEENEKSFAITEKKFGNYYPLYKNKEQMRDFLNNFEDVKKEEIKTETVEKMPAGEEERENKEVLLELENKIETAINGMSDDEFKKYVNYDGPKAKYKFYYSNIDKGVAMDEWFKDKPEQFNEILGKLGVNFEEVKKAEAREIAAIVTGFCLKRGEKNEKEESLANLSIKDSIVKNVNFPEGAKIKIEGQSIINEGKEPETAEDIKVEIVALEGFLKKQLFKAKSAGVDNIGFVEDAKIETLKNEIKKLKNKLNELEKVKKTTKEEKSEKAKEKTDEQEIINELRTRKGRAGEKINSFLRKGEERNDSKEFDKENLSEFIKILNEEIKNTKDIDSLIGMFGVANDALQYGRIDKNIGNHAATFSSLFSGTRKITGEKVRKLIAEDKSLSEDKVRETIKSMFWMKGDYILDKNNKISKIINELITDKWRE